MIRVLVVDDKRGLRSSLCLLLKNAGFAADEAASGKAALQAMEQAAYDIVVADLRLDDMSGIDLLKEIRRRYSDLPVIIITAYGTIGSAVEATRLGAFDYLTKPFSDVDIIEKIQSSQRLRNVLNSQLEPLSDAILNDTDIIATTPHMRAILIKVGRLSQADISVLISGETGTGKTKVARLIHNKSQRAARPFVSVNCASLPEQLLESELFGHIRGSFTGATDSRIGLFEEADGGTIFLDEIDTLSLPMQAKLLHVFHDCKIRQVGSNKSRPVDVRVISASNQDLPQLIEMGTFRSDLYFRINGVRLHLPPLREREGDISLLVASFLQKFGSRYGKRNLLITPQAMEYVLGHPYPGNIRQLESIVEQMTVFADDDGKIDIDTLPEELLHLSPPLNSPLRRGQLPESSSLIESERHLIEATLLKCPRLGEASRELGIGRTTLWRKMRQYDIKTPHKPR